MKSFLLAASIVGVLAGCASTDGSTAGEPKPVSERVYRTGSNIPVRDPAPLTKEEKERQAEEAQRSLTVSPRPLVR